MTTTSRRPARGQSLPEDEAQKLRQMSRFSLYRRVNQLFSAGWTLRAIGEAFSPPKTRSTVQSWVDKGYEVPQGLITTTIDFVPVPAYATPPVYIPVKAPSPGISASDRTLIEDLAPIARRYRSGMHPNHKASTANQLLTDTCKRLYDSGVSIRELADAAGVTYRAMTKRLGRS